MKTYTWIHISMMNTTFAVDGNPHNSDRGAYQDATGSDVSMSTLWHSTDVLRVRENRSYVRAQPAESDWALNTLVHWSTWNSFRQGTFLTPRVSIISFPTLTPRSLQLKSAAVDKNDGTISSRIRGATTASNSAVRESFRKRSVNFQISERVYWYEIHTNCERISVLRQILLRAANTGSLKGDNLGRCS